VSLLNCRLVGLLAQGMRGRAVVTQGYELPQRGAVYADSTVYTMLCIDGVNTYSALPFLSRTLHHNIRSRRLQMSLGGMAVVYGITKKLNSLVYNTTNVQPRSHLSIPGRSKGVFSCPKCPDPLWVPSRLLTSEYRPCFPWGVSGEGVNLTTLSSAEGNE
jgi:hypothetical protein